MSHFFDWKIKGYYDGGVLIIENNVDPQECVFLDMEICRTGVKSIGQHMLYYNMKRPPHPDIEKQFSNCLSPNNLRGHDFQGNFMRKYPFATIHLLMALLPHEPVKEQDRFAPLFYVDGTFKSLLNYPENCLDWLDFLDSKNNPLDHLFHGNYPVYQLMTVMRDFFLMLKSIREKRADKLSIRIGKSNVANITGGAFPLQEKMEAELFLQKMGEILQWHYQPKKWEWGNFIAHEFESNNVKPTLGRFQNVMAQHPISWAITSRESIGYTLDRNNIFSP